MAWLEFKADFDWSPPEFNGWSTTAYKAGMLCSVTTACAAAAVEAGAANRVRHPGKDNVEPLKADPFWRPPDAEAPNGR